MTTEPTIAGRKALTKPGKKGNRTIDIVTYVVLLAAAAFALIPLLWGLSTSLKPAVEASSWPPTWLPRHLTFDHYATVLNNPKYIRYLLNTVGVTMAVMLIGLTLSAHAAWAVVRHRFIGKRTMLFLMWTTIMIPGISIIVPLYLMAVDVGLYDTYAVLVVVYCATIVPTLVWLLRGFVAGVPAELEEAALIDGCGRIAVFYRIVLPLLRPGLGAAAVLVFVTVWNEFLIGYALVLGDEHRLIQVGVYYFVTETGIEWGPLMAGMFISVLPVVVLFASLQKFFIQGLTGGAVKG